MRAVHQASSSNRSRIPNRTTGVALAPKGVQGAVSTAPVRPGASSSACWCSGGAASRVQGSLIIGPIVG